MERVTSTAIVDAEPTVAQGKLWPDGRVYRQYADPTGRLIIVEHCCTRFHDACRALWNRRCVVYYKLTASRS